MRRTFVGVALALTLFTTGSASAKMPGHGLRFCGPSACHTVTDVDRMSAIGRALAVDRTATTRPARPGPFYSVAWAGASGWPVAYYVPEAGLVRVEEHVVAVHWLPLAGAKKLFDDAVHGIAPFPTPRLSKSYVDLYERLARGERVPDPLGPRPALEWRNYKALVRYYERDRRLWIPIRVKTRIPSPWTDDAAQLAVGRRHYLLRGDGTVVRVPRPLAQRIRKGGR